MLSLSHPRKRFAALALLATLVTAVPAGSQTGTEFRAVPLWAKDAVWYQIFPERFRNGDPSNDPRVADIEGSWPHETPEQWNISSWTGDWYALQPWEQSGKGFYYYAQQRRYGGDLQGVIDELDYLKDLGINALYFNPLFESPSLHKYDATMYHHIDNNFGPDPAGDRLMWTHEDPSDPGTWQWTSADRLFLDLIKQAHRRGIRVIIDGVFNHVGMTFWAFRDVVERGENSRFKDWFVVKRLDDPSTPENEFDYEGWNGVRELPEIREDENGLVPGPREHVHAIVRRWMDPDGDGDPSDGIDGWRLDVAEKVNLNFWKEFRRWIREINPDAYTVGEIFWDDWRNGKMFNAAPWLLGDAFDAVMNYRWSREVGHFFKDRERKTTAAEFDRRLSRLRKDYSDDVDDVLMNCLDSHDTDRLASQVVNVDAEYDRNVGVQGNPDYLVRKPDQDERRTQRLIVLFQMTSQGAPTVYYGSEAGMWGADDPDDRKPMLWPDMGYDDEVSHPLGKVRPADRNEFDRDLFSYYKTLIGIRNGSKALRRGTTTTILADDETDILAFERSYQDDTVLVFINNGLTSRDMQIPDRTGSSGYRTLYGSPGSERREDGMTLLLPAKSGMILQVEGKAR